MSEQAEVDPATNDEGGDAGTEPAGAGGISRPAVLLLAGLGLGVGADALRAGGSVGIGFTVLIGAALAVLLALSAAEETPVRWRNVATLGAPLLFFAVMASVRDNGFLTFWNVAASVVLLALLCGYLAAGRLETAGFGDLWRVPWRVTLGSLHRPAPLVADVLGEGIRDPERRARALPLLRGLLLAAPVLLVFGWLLSSADAVFARLLSETGRRLLPTDAKAALWHVGVALGVAWLLAGAFTHALTRREAENPPLPRDTPLGFVEAMTVLTGVCGIFLAFVAVQFAYLFGGHARVQTVPGLTYSEYAHRGFKELVTVALLTLLLGNALRAVADRSSARQNVAFNGVGTLLVGLTLVLLASAYHRMAVYEAAYGATETRLYVDVLLFWLGVALVWFAVTLWAGLAERFPSGVFACGIGLLTTLNVINPDAMVAQTNLRRFRETGRLDVWTLYRLSADATPQLVAGYEALPAGSNEKKAVAAILRLRLDQLESPAGVPWVARHAARAKAYSVLSARAALLPDSRQADDTVVRWSIPGAR